MADHVPGIPSGPPKVGEGEDAGETTAAAKAPALPPPPDGGGTGEDERTVRRTVDTRLLRAERAAKAAPPKPAKPPEPPKPEPVPLSETPVRMTSKRATVQGLGLPEPLGRRSASSPPPTLNEADEADDSITATAPSLSTSGAAAAIVPRPAPGLVKITQLSEEEGDETEVRTVVTTLSEPGALRAGLAKPPIRRKKPVPAAGRPADDGPDAIDDSVTAQAPAPSVSAAETEPKTQPPILAPPRPGSSPTSLPDNRVPSAEMVDTYETDESITGRAPALPFGGDDSVTAEGPAVPGTAPPRVRVVPKLNPDEPPHNHTAVMANAPVKPPAGMGKPAAKMNLTAPMQASSVSAVAVGRDPQSDSGLRIAPLRADGGGGEKASAQIVLGGVPKGRYSDPDVANAFAPTAPIFAPLDPAIPGPPKSTDGAAKKPNYALLVGLAALGSVVIPVVLYFTLRSPPEPAEVRTPATVELVPVGLADGLKKAPKPPPSTSTAPTSTTRIPWWKRH